MSDQNYLRFRTVLFHLPVALHNLVPLFGCRPLRKALPASQVITSSYFLSGRCMRHHRTATQQWYLFARLPLLPDHELREHLVLAMPAPTGVPTSGAPSNSFVTLSAEISRIVYAVLSEVFLFGTLTLHLFLKCFILLGLVLHSRLNPLQSD